MQASEVCFLANKASPQISVIVPVYNYKEYLRRCLDSILAQTFADWECIVVDDGSSDGSAAICDEYAQKDSRFVVIHKQNGGVSSARNAGLGKARGRYLLFCDADDVMHPATMQLALDWQQRFPTDLICWRLTRAQQSTLLDAAPGSTAYSSAQRRVYVTTVDGHSNCNKLFWAQLIRRHGLRYDPALARAEDYVFGGAYLDAFFAENPEAHIRQLEAPLYFWRENMASASHKKLKADRHARVDWEPEEFRDYARRLLAEYTETRLAMNGWQGMAPADLAPQLRTYLRRFAFCIWAAGQLGESLPAGFTKSPQIAEVLDLLKGLRAFTPYYLPFKLGLTGLLGRMYESEESGRMTLYRFMYTLTYYTLFLCGGKRWQQA